MWSIIKAKTRGTSTQILKNFTNFEVNQTWCRSYFRVEHQGHSLWPIGVQMWSEIDIEIKINGNIISRSLGRLERDDIQDIAFKPVGNLKGNIISYSCQSNCLSLCLWLGSRSSLGPPEVLMLKISELTVFRHFRPWNCSHQGSKLVIFSKIDRNCTTNFEIGEFLF